MVWRYTRRVWACISRRRPCQHQLIMQFSISNSLTQGSTFLPSSTEANDVTLFCLHWRHHVVFGSSFAQISIAFTAKFQMHSKHNHLSETEKTPCLAPLQISILITITLSKLPPWTFMKWEALTMNFHYGFTKITSQCRALANHSTGLYRSSKGHHQGSKALRIHSLKHEFELLSNNTCWNTSCVELFTSISLGFEVRDSLLEKYAK